MENYLFKTNKKCLTFQPFWKSMNAVSRNPETRRNGKTFAISCNILWSKNKVAILSKLVVFCVVGKRNCFFMTPSSHIFNLDFYFFCMTGFVISTCITCLNAFLQNVISNVSKLIFNIQDEKIIKTFLGWQKFCLKNAGLRFRQRRK